MYLELLYVSEVSYLSSFTLMYTTRGVLCNTSKNYSSSNLSYKQSTEQAVSQSPPCRDNMLDLNSQGLAAGLRCSRQDRQDDCQVPAENSDRRQRKTETDAGVGIRRGASVLGKDKEEEKRERISVFSSDYSNHGSARVYNPEFQL
jgi:hypothetical protein